MHDFRRVESLLCDEIAQIVNNGELTPSSLDVVHKSIDTIKNIKKIKMLDEVSDYGEYEERKSRSYRGGSDRGYHDGYSYKRDSMGRYARDGFVGQLEQLMNEAPNEQVRNKINDLLNQM